MVDVTLSVVTCDGKGLEPVMQKSSERLLECRVTCSTHLPIAVWPLGLSFTDQFLTKIQL